MFNRHIGGAIEFLPVAPSVGGSDYSSGKDSIRGRQGRWEMGTILLIVVVILLLGGGGGYSATASTEDQDSAAL